MIKKINLDFSQINIIAEKLANFVLPGDVIALIGDLGTGKTSFTKAFAKGLGIKDNLKSPTFNYVLEYYTGRIPLYHFDVYRISDPQEVYEIGYDEYINGKGISVIEWADMIKSELPEKYICLELEYLNEDSRNVSISFVGDKVREKEMLKYVGLGDRYSN